METKATWLKIYVFPLLMVFSLFGDSNILNGLDILGIKTNLSISDIGFLGVIISCLVFYAKDLLQELQDNKKIFGFIVCFLSFILAGSLFDNPCWLISLKTWLKVYVMFFLFLWIFRTSVLTRRSLNIVCLIVIGLNLIGIVENFFINKEAVRHFLLFFRSQESVQPQYYVASLFTNPNPYGVFNALYLVTMSAVFAGNKNAVNRYLLVITLVSCCVGLVLSASRNALLVFCCGMMVLASFQIMRTRSIKTVGFLCLVLVLIFVFFVKSDQSIANKFGEVFPVATKIRTGEKIELADIKINLMTQGLKDRNGIWQTGLQKVKQKPLMGWGISASQFRIGFSKPFSMHNFYLETLVSNGIIGLVLLLALIAVWLTRLRAGWCWAPVVALLISFVFDTFFDLCSAWLVFVVWVVAITTKDIFISVPADDIKA